MHKLRLRHNFRCALYGTPMAYRIMGGVFNPFLWLLLGMLVFLHVVAFSPLTVAAPLIAAASNKKIFSGQFAAASVQKIFYRYTEVDLRLT